jgi:hypothetical protein
MSRCRKEFPALAPPSKQTVSGIGQPDGNETATIYMEIKQSKPFYSLRAEVGLGLLVVVTCCAEAMQ